KKIMNIKWNRMIQGTIAGTMMISLIFINPTKGYASFSDTDKHWAKGSIDAAVQQGYVSGYEDGTFRPNNQVTRAEFTAMIVAASNLEVKPASGGTWYEPIVAAATTAGLTTPDEFKGNWNTKMTRLEMARMAVRATGEKNTDAKKWMYLVTKTGIMSGYGGGELGTDKTTTRAEAVVVIDRVLKVKAGGKLVADKHAVSQAELAWHKTNIFTVMPDFFAGEIESRKWDPNNLDLKTPDGKFYGVLDTVVAIDLADPNDPNLKELPDINKLKWFNYRVNDDGVPGGYPVMQYKDSYILLFKTHVVYNNNKAKYGDFMFSSINGIKMLDKAALEKGKLNSIAGVFLKKSSDLPAFIIPKKGLQTRGDLQLIIMDSSMQPFSKIVVGSIVPEQM
ncbi:MAG: S-layer homology domain-containing protein, partial [Gorillibacterium sp.]|nr:S-layer homology domain-containing protein [Gorillibacterium sp.]